MLPAVGVLPDSAELVVPIQFASSGTGDLVTVYVQPAAVAVAGAVYLGAAAAIVVLDGQF